MPRHLRHHRPGRWYHITTPGVGRRTLFHTDRDREHFVELLEGMVERYSIILHALYVEPPGWLTCTELLIKGQAICIDADKGTDYLH